MKLKKVFLQTQFGEPHSWTEQYFENVKMLEPYGWFLKVFTPNPWKSEANIEIVPMTIHDFDALIEKRCGVAPGNFIHNGRPHKLVSDYYPAYGHIFNDFIRGFDFWAHTNWDMVYGRLDRFIPDDTLGSLDIWSDDVNAINGIFCVYRNLYGINNLFRQVPQWEKAFTEHSLFAYDEVYMTRLMRRLQAEGSHVRFGYPRYFGHHSYDRLVQHTPAPNVYFESDGALIERFEDTVHPHVSFPKGHFGREIMAFHFSRTKKWPIEMPLAATA